MEQVQIIFEFNTDHGVFRDALYLPIDHNLKEEQIEDIKQRQIKDRLETMRGSSQQEVFDNA